MTGKRRFSMREKLIYSLFIAVIGLLAAIAYFLTYTEPQGSKAQEGEKTGQKQNTAQPPALTPDDSFVLTELNGQTLQQFAVHWWTWIYSIPRDKVSPVIDPDGKSCGYNQAGDVWFLAGSPGDDLRYVRDCTIPKGKHIFFPVFTLISKSKPICSSAQIHAEIEPDRLLSVEVTLDNKIIPDPRKFRAKSPGCFRLKGYIQSRYESMGIYPVATDGYWILLKPLEPGTHTLRFKVQYVMGSRDKGKNEGEKKANFIQDVMYNLKIE